VPLFIQNLLAYSTTVVAVGFVGHLNQPELLSAAVLANSLYNVTGYSLLQGLASGMESLCGQVRWQLPVLSVLVCPSCTQTATSMY
jgi:MATE family multidrug resistance protein